MLKKAIAVVLCAALAIGMVGCNKKETPEAREKMLVQKLSQAKTLDMNMKLNLKMNIEQAGNQSIVLDINTKMDINGSFPKMSMDGTMGVENMMSLPVKLYMDEQGMVMNMMGQTQNTPMTEEAKKQIKDSMAKANEQSGNANGNLTRKVEEMDYNGERALKSTFDVNQLNQLLSSAMAAQSNSMDDMKISKMEVIYVTDKDQIKQMIADVVITNGNESIDAHIEMTINSMGQPITITPISADDNSPSIPFTPAA